MLTRFAAQGLVDGLSALTLTGAVFGLARRGSPLWPSLVFAFGSLSLFFAARAAFEATTWPVLEAGHRMVACVLPISALLLAEGVLRRHAPRILKLFVAAGALAALAAVSSAPGEPWSDAVLAVYEIVSLAGITFMLLARDQSSLSHQENAGISALVGMGLLVTLASAADFIPAAPVGLSGVGAASVAFVLAANPASAREARRVIVEFLVLVLVAGAFAVVLGRTLNLNSAAEMVRLGAVLLALLLAAAAAMSAVQARSGVSEIQFASALARADTSGLDRFLDRLAEQPLLTGMRMAEGGQLSDYDSDGLSAALSAGAVWTPRAIANAAIAERPRDELLDLMSRYEATHAVMISKAPLRIALLTLPDGGASEPVEARLALFGKLAALIAEATP